MMNIDFTNEIIKMKEKEVLNKPFPGVEGYALFTKSNEEIIKLVFSDEGSIKDYLNNLGYDWGNEKKDEYTNFDCEKRLMSVLPELKNAKTFAANSKNSLPKGAIVIKHKPLYDEVDYVKTLNRKIEDSPHAVEIREVDHPILWDKSNYDKKNSKSYSNLYDKVSGKHNGFFQKGDSVKNINKNCIHYKSEGVVEKINELPKEKGSTVSYKCSNSGEHWKEGDVLEKTPDQLEKK